ncbi:MAG: protein translocase subunit SecD [Proteobacteria bacterium]|nr:MAG: protein translocase subunit SecD [Pseudomonadota bacterium]
MNSLRWRTIGVVLSLLLFGWYAAMNFVPAAARKASDWLPDQALRLGLDLQGGIHWVLGPNLAVAIDHELDVLRASIADTLAEKKITPTRMAVESGQLVAEMASADDARALREAAAETEVLRVASEQDARVVFALTPEWEQEVRRRGMEQMLEVVRRRIDDPIRGIPESVVTRQGADRVLVQIPGGQLDREQARNLLQQTGFLEFKLVLDEAPTRELLEKKYEAKGGLPADTMIAEEKEKGTDRPTSAYLVPKSPNLTGDFLTDARSSIDPRYGWIVNFTFNSEGATRFGKLTGENVGKRLAILLDGDVASAPTLQSRIGGGRGMIHGRFDAQSASDLAVILRAGSLPIPMRIEEERTIGPALGADSVRGGVWASLLGFALVAAFAVFYYRLSGVYATVGLLANLVFLLGVMAMSEATLTMPGIAGLVLTVGMAIDANVIIYERIREEIRAGKLPRAAIRTGFNKAFWTIMDANITTLIVGIVLFQYGSGPIKGFAVTLCIGIATSVFSALVIPRLLFDVYPGNRPVQRLSI